MSNKNNLLILATICGIVAIMYMQKNKTTEYFQEEDRDVQANISALALYVERNPKRKKALDAYIKKNIITEKKGPMTIHPDQIDIWDKKNREVTVNIDKMLKDVI